MMKDVFLKAFEEKLAEELPGGFPLKQPYTMPARVRRTVGAPVSQGTVPNMSSTGTALGKKPLGMAKKPVGMAKKAKPDIVKPVSPMQKFMGGFNVKPRMVIAKPPKAGMVRYGSCHTLEQAKEAIQ